VAETSRRRTRATSRAAKEIKPTDLKLELFSVAAAAEGGQEGLDLLRAGLRFLRVPGFPTTHSITVPLIMHAPTGWLESPHGPTLALEILNPEGADATEGHEIELVYQRARGGQLGDPEIWEAILRVVDVPLDIEGRYTLVFRADDHELGRTWFRAQAPRTQER
jgi:hypothetical protein